MSNTYGEIPKSTVILAGALWAILAVLGSIILATVLSVKDTQSTMLANQVTNRRDIDSVAGRLGKVEESDAKQNERIAVLETKAKK